MELALERRIDHARAELDDQPAEEARIDAEVDGDFARRPPCAAARRALRAAPAVSACAEIDLRRDLAAPRGELGEESLDHLPAARRAAGCAPGGRGNCGSAAGAARCSAKRGDRLALRGAGEHRAADHAAQIGALVEQRRARSADRRPPRRAPSARRRARTAPSHSARPSPPTPVASDATKYASPYRKLPLPAPVTPAPDDANGDWKTPAFRPFSTPKPARKNAPGKRRRFLTWGRRRRNRARPPRSCDNAPPTAIVRCGSPHPPTLRVVFPPPLAGEG